MERLDIFPLKVMRPAALLRFLDLPELASRPGHSYLFRYLLEDRMNILFLTESGHERNVRNLSLVVDSERVEKRLQDLGSLRELTGVASVQVEAPVAVIRILGPHFDIRPGIVGPLFETLERGRIDVLAVSTTITTTLLVIREDQAERTVRLLGSLFRTPGKK